jgi:hypothetical protein
MEKPPDQCPVLPHHGGTRREQIAEEVDQLLPQFLRVFLQGEFAPPVACKRIDDNRIG